MYHDRLLPKDLVTHVIRMLNAESKPRLSIASQANEPRWPPRAMKRCPGVEILLRVVPAAGYVARHDDVGSGMRGPT